MGGYMKYLGYLFTAIFWLVILLIIYKWGIVGAIVVAVMFGGIYFIQQSK
jgi:hypothetical protein